MTRAHRPRRIRTIAGLVVSLAGGPAGCYDGFDPLDPEVLAEVARSRGDARGFERSGVYVGTFEALDCGCADVDTRFDASLCVTFERLEAIGLPAELGLELVQADGTVRMQVLGLGDFFGAEADLLPVFYGPLQADGRVSAAGVLKADALVVRGEVLGRIDGSIELGAEGWVLAAEYQQRYAVDLLGGGGDVLDFSEPESVLQTVDCRERVGLDLRWEFPPLVPVGPG